MGTAVATAPPPSQARRLTKFWRDGDQIAHLVTLIFAASVFVVTVLLVYELWIHSGPSRAKFGFGFLTGTTWDPVAEQFGALPFIYGTVLTSLLALLISVPLGVGAAIFLAELAPPSLSNACTFLVELLAAVPSVILGLLAIFTLVPLMRQYIEPFLKDTLGFLPLFQGPAYGVGYLTAGIDLSHHDVSRSSFRSPGKRCWPCRANSARPPWLWAPPSGSPPGRWWCRSPGWASSDRFSWRWPAPWAKPWRSPW